MVLDEPAPPVLAGISVLGVLSFADIDVELAADFVDIFESGALEVGTESAPLTNHAAMRLTGEQAGSLPYDDDGTKPGAGQALSLRVFGGRLDLHGKAPSPGWTRAQTTFAAGTTELDLSDEVDWPAGATIVVASTDFDPGQTEERAIVANDTVSGSGTGTLRVAALDHMHFGGEAGPYGGMTVQMHAEVAVLERNVKVYSDPSGLDERSGQIRIMSTAITPSSTPRPPSWVSRCMTATSSSTTRRSPSSRTTSRTASPGTRRRSARCRSSARGPSIPATAWRRSIS